VQLFGTTRQGDYINSVYNFRNSGNAMLTMFRILFGAADAHPVVCSC
jgi:hypothetical protein